MLGKCSNTKVQPHSGLQPLNSNETVGHNDIFLFPPKGSEIQQSTLATRNSTEL